MSTRTDASTAAWKDPTLAASFVGGDVTTGLLDLPRQLAATIVAGECGDGGVVVDVAGGAGAFLATFLRRLATARGICLDASPAMLALGREALADFGDRVEFALGDMRDLDGGGPPASAAAVISSRASHHLEDDELGAFYAAAAALASPGGFVVNLDHIGPPADWNRRYRAARAEIIGVQPASCFHEHRDPFASLEVHLDAMHRAGLVEVDVAWKAFYTVLLIGRRQ